MSFGPTAASAQMKALNILLLKHGQLAFVVSTFSALAAFIALMLSMLTRRRTVEFPWCLCSGVVTYYLTLPLCQRRSLVLLDIACIHQKDQQLKGDGLLSLGATSKNSKSLLVLHEHTRWLMVEGVCARQPLEAAAALLQGCPSSPLA